ncbi:MAG: thermonuclease family protein [Kofleriaceae bacterium]
MTRRLLVSLTTLLALLLACSPVGGQRYSRNQAQKSLKKLEAPGLVLGEFRITKVIDGDTVKVDGLDSSLRLVGIDAEETFKKEANRRASETDFAAYLIEKRAGHKRPVKIESPMGEAAKQWGIKFFEDVDVVRIERDDPTEIRDRYNRYLAYVLANKRGAWLNYNVELVRAGMSPYFPKYGYSRRFHHQFLDAQAEAKAAKRGIWAPGAMAANDYPEREAWWMARGAFVDEFRKAAATKPNYVELTRWDAMNQIEQMIGKEVVLLGTVNRVSYGQKGPSRVTLARGFSSDFPLIFFDRDVLGTSGLVEWEGEFVEVTGVPTLYENKHTHKKQLQIVVDRASQIRLSAVPGLVAPTTQVSSP